MTVLIFNYWTRCPSLQSRDITWFFWHRRTVNSYHVVLCRFEIPQEPFHGSPSLEKYEPYVCICFYRVFERGGVKVVVDELSLTFIAGSTIDYYHELIRSSFRIMDNPNASLGCSCGVSFALKWHVLLPTTVNLCKLKTLSISDPSQTFMCSKLMLWICLCWPFLVSMVAAAVLLGSGCG